VLANPNAGSAALFGELSLSSNVPIYGFSVTAPTPNQILNLDNLTFTVADVPEPQDAALFGAGLGMLGLGLRRRMRGKKKAA
jgi:GTPase involved in cell partitioning and DNA repair